MLSEKKPLVRFAKSSRTFHPKRARATVNSANSTNCVIPKRVVDRLDAASRRAMGGAKDEQKKSRCEGCGRSNLQGKEREEDACTRSYLLFFASSAIPGTFSPKLAVVSRRGDYKAPRFLPALPFLPLSRPDPMQYTTLAYHTYFVLKHRTERVCISARTRMYVSSRIQGELIIKFSFELSFIVTFLSFAKRICYDVFIIGPIELKILNFRLIYFINYRESISKVRFYFFVLYRHTFILLYSNFYIFFIFRIIHRAI